MTTIHIDGWPSFREWADAGYPGAVSFPPERLPDPRAGLCEVFDCPNKEYMQGLCITHNYYGRRRAVAR